jgi:hypothetical protein
MTLHLAILDIILDLTLSKTKNMSIYRVPIYVPNNINCSFYPFPSSPHQTKLSRSVQFECPAMKNKIAAMALVLLLLTFGE